MQLGMIGLGRMGANLVRRTMAAGHECVVYDPDTAAVDALVGAGAVGATLGRRPGREDDPAARGVADGPRGHHRRGRRRRRRAPVGRRRDHRRRQLALRRRHRARRGARAARHRLRRLRNERWRLRPRARLLPDDRRARTHVVQRLDPIFRALAPGLGAIERTPGRARRPAPEELGYLHCGPAGAGHFVKMVHNGIEYALMAAYAEGPDDPAPRRHRVAQERTADAETAPLTTPRALPVRPRHPQGRRGVAARQRRRVVVARPDRRRRCRSRPISPSSAAASATPAKAAGPSRPRSTKACPRP